MALYVDIEKKLGSFRLDVQFEAGNEPISLLGASGCGKSMTLKCIAGIETPDRGRIVLDERVLFDSEKKINIPPQERRTGYLFQHGALFPNMNVLKNVMCGVRRKCSGAEKEKNPSMSETVPLVVPLTRTDAPMTGSPVVLSRTFPSSRTVFCASIGTVPSTIPTALKRMTRSLFIQY